MYNKDNISGIIFSHSKYEFRVGNTNDKTCELYDIHTDWESLNFPIKELVERLNNKTYVVLEHPNKIHECW